MIKACIFDLDGVIVDTAKYHFLAWKRLANSLDFNFTEKENELLKGVGRNRSLELILQWGGINKSSEEQEELAFKKNKWYIEYVEQLNQNDLLPGVKTFLDELKSKGIKIALGSASKNAKLILNKLEIVDYFDAIVDGTNVSKAKPNPQVFLNGAKALQLKPEECIVFEDAIAGVEAAKNAGMLCVGIGHQDNLNKADYLMSGFEGVTYNTLLQKLIK